MRFELCFPLPHDQLQNVLAQSVAIWIHLGQVPTLFWCMLRERRQDRVLHGTFFSMGSDSNCAHSSLTVAMETAASTGPTGGQSERRIAWPNCPHRFGGVLAVFLIAANLTSSVQRETLPCRLACGHKPRPLFRADRSQSWAARPIVRRSAVYPRNPLVFPRPSPESFDFQ